jgi:CRISP-associated protein Cas1
MPTIVISDPESTLSVDQTHFTLRAHNRKVGRIPPGIMDQVVIHHGVEVSRKALSRLGAIGVPVTFLDAEGRVEARLVPHWKYDAAPRLGQARAHLDPASRLLLARRLVDAKLANGLTVIRQHAGNHPDPALTAAAATLRDLRARLRRVTDIPELLGVEGIAGRTYFQALGRMLRVEWTEFKRAHPPPTPGPRQCRPLVRLRRPGQSTDGLPGICWLGPLHWLPSHPRAASAGSGARSYGTVPSGTR